MRANPARPNQSGEVLATPPDTNAEVLGTAPLPRTRASWERRILGTRASRPQMGWQDRQRSMRAGHERSQDPLFPGKSRGHRCLASESVSVKESRRDPGGRRVKAAVVGTTGPGRWAAGRNPRPAGFGSVDPGARYLAAPASDPETRCLAVLVGAVSWSARGACRPVFNTMGRMAENRRPNSLEPVAGCMDRWAAAGRRLIRERRANPMETKLHQLAALMASASEMGWSEALGAEDDGVRARWMAARGSEPGGESDVRPGTSPCQVCEAPCRDFGTWAAC